MHFPKLHEHFFFTFFENDSIVEKPVEKPETPVVENKEQKRTYSEEEFQKAIDAEKQRANESTRKAINELEQLKKLSGTTESQKADLQKKIDDLNSQFMTREQLLKQEKEKLVSTYESTVKTVSSERDQWKDRYIRTRVDRELADAASKHDAYNTETFLAMLGPKTNVVEEKDADGNTTGFSVKVKMTKFDTKENKNIELTLDPDQAVKQMKDRPEEYGFLFKGHTNAGVGGKPSEKLSNADYENMDIDAYAKHRERILS